VGQAHLPYQQLASGFLKQIWEWEAAAHSVSAEGQSRKFFFLKGKIKKKEGRAQKMKGKIFCFARHKASAAAGRGPRSRLCQPAPRAGWHQKSASGFFLK